MIFNLKMLLIPLLALGVVGDDPQAGPGDGQGNKTEARLEIEGNPDTRVNVQCSKEVGLRRKIIKQYWSNFCDNWVDKQPHNVSSDEMTWHLQEPWHYWSLKLYWSSKDPTAPRNCKATFKAMASKKGCGNYRWQGYSLKVVVSTTARGEEHYGPETYGWVLTPPEDPHMPPEDPQ